MHLVYSPYPALTALASVDAAVPHQHAQVVHCPRVEEDVLATHSLDHTATSSLITAPTPMLSLPTMVSFPN